MEAFSLVQRASQLEAERLDDEIIELLFLQARSALRHFPDHSVAELISELRFAVRALFYAGTLIPCIPSPGLRLHNLHYRRALPRTRGAGPLHDAHVIRFGHESRPLATRQIIALLLLQVLLPYVWARVRRHARDTDADAIDTETRWGARGNDGAGEALERGRQWRRMRRWGERGAAWGGVQAVVRMAERAADAVAARMRRDGGARRAVSVVETGVQVLVLANMLAFLAGGRYPRLSHRLAGVQLKYKDVAATRFMSFEFVNRQLVWAGFAEFFVFVTPLLTSARLYGLVRRVVAKIGAVGSTVLSSRQEEDGGRRADTVAEGDVDADGRGSPGGGDIGHCPLCMAQVLCMPYLALPCRHWFCYVCLSVATDKNPEFRCPECQTRVHQTRRVCAT